MPRYEGMDELLQQVRDRLGVVESGGLLGASAMAEAPQRSEQYENMLEVLLLLLRDAEQLGNLATPEQLRGLTAEQREDLQSILGKALRQLWSCKTALERVKLAE